MQGAGGTRGEENENVVQGEPRGRFGGDFGD